MDRFRTTRRTLLRTAAAGAVSAVAFPCIVPSSVLGGDENVAPSNRVTLGLLGTSNINGQHRQAFLAEKRRAYPGGMRSGDRSSSGCT